MLLCTYQYFPPEVGGGGDYPRELDIFEKLESKLDVPSNLDIISSRFSSRDI